MKIWLFKPETDRKFVKFIKLKVHKTFETWSGLLYCQ